MHSKLATGVRKKEDKVIVTQVDENLVYRQLKGGQQTVLSEFDITEEIESGGFSAEDSGSKTEVEQRVYQLTGYSDSIYAEAFVEVHHYDILMKVILVNRTNKTLPAI